MYPECISSSISAQIAARFAFGYIAAQHPEIVELISRVDELLQSGDSAALQAAMVGDMAYRNGYSSGESAEDMLTFMGLYLDSVADSVVSGNNSASAATDAEACGQHHCGGCGSCGRHKPADTEHHAYIRQEMASTSISFNKEGGVKQVFISCPAGIKTELTVNDQSFAFSSVPGYPEEPADDESAFAEENGPGTDG